MTYLDREAEAFRIIDEDLSHYAEIADPSVIEELAWNSLREHYDDIQAAEIYFDWFRIHRSQPDC